jgi:ketosteroid isomerase-like protein
MWSFVLGLLLLFPAAAMAVPPAQAPDEQALLRLSADWMAAIERKDQAALESFLADDFVLQMPGDQESQRVHRAEWLKNAIGMDWSEFRYENMAARVHGDHAMVTSRLYFKVAPWPLHFDSAVVDTWERRGGQWQVTARYLGESELQTRIAFWFGVVAAGGVLLLAWLGRRIYRWSRARAA